VVKDYYNCIQKIKENFQLKQENEKKQRKNKTVKIHQKENEISEFSVFCDVITSKNR